MLRIHIVASVGCLKSNSIPASGVHLLTEHQALFHLRRRLGEFDVEAMRPAGGDDRQDRSIVPLKLGVACFRDGIHSE